MTKRVIKSYRGEEIAESYGRQCPQTKKMKTFKKSKEHLCLAMTKINANILHELMDLLFQNSSSQHVLCLVNARQTIAMPGSRHLQRPLPQVSSCNDIATDVRLMTSHQRKATTESINAYLYLQYLKLFYSLTFIMATSKTKWVHTGMGYDAKGQRLEKFVNKCFLMISIDNIKN